MRLIDADKALKIAESYGTTHGTTLGRHSGVADTIYDEIAKLPTIEAQPVRHGVWRLMHNSYDRAKEYNNSFFKGQRQNTLLCSCQLGDRRMPNKDEITTKFKVDISDLKKNITEANQNIKLANAQFKAASAGMDDWSKSSEGIKAKLGQLNTVLTEQNKKLESYKQQQKALDAAYQENGKRADELKAKLAELASQGIAKTSEEYKKYEKALSEVEKEQAANKKTSDDLKVTILNQQAAVNKTEKELKDYANALDDVETESKDVDKVSDDIEKSLDEVGESADKAESKVGKLAKGIAKGLTKALAAGAAVAGTALVGLIKSSIQSYSETEQLIGGVKTLFGTEAESVEEYAESVGKSVDEVKDKYDELMQSQETVLKNANNAYKTAGMSANEYMETVTGFSASLLQSLDGDTVKAADAANQAIIDMSDNANKMGTDIESIKNTYQGFAKQNYTMLDNLKLGYGGTKEEMERLLADATTLSGVEYDISNLNDVYDAIHVIQDELAITGTTAKEASTTIQGSVSSMKAAWTNLITGIADDNQDFDQLLTNFIDSIGTVAANLLPRISTALNGVNKACGGAFATNTAIVTTITAYACKRN